MIVNVNCKAYPESLQTCQRQCSLVEQYMQDRRNKFSMDWNISRDNQISLCCSCMSVALLYFSKVNNICLCSTYDIRLFCFLPFQILDFNNTCHLSNIYSLWYQVSSPEIDTYLIH